jgi:hypothetical protein
MTRVDVNTEGNTGEIISANRQGNAIKTAIILKKFIVSV